MAEAITVSEYLRLVAERYADGEAFQRHWAGPLAPQGRRLVERLPLVDAVRVLDAGTGVGTLLPEIHRLAPRAFVVGIDLTRGMVSLAPPRFGRAVMDASAMGFRDEAFDAVVMAFVLFHLPEPSAGVAEIHRVLRPGGHVAIATWAPIEDLPADRIWNQLLEAHGARAGQVVARHELTDSHEKMRDLLERGGFVVVDTESNVVEDPMDLEEFLARRTSLGLSKWRVNTLPPPSREEFLRVARERLARLGPEGYLSRDVALLTWAKKPAP